ncbi:MAG: succinyl-diaminopimelate desuccinylase [Actinomycetota bacterium]
MSTTTLPVDLVALTGELIDVRSESFHEQDLVELLAERLGRLDHLAVERVGDNLVARTDLGRPHRLLLVGHTDTVPANDNERAVIDGDVVSGLGASDMKGGLAVFLALAEHVHDPMVDVGWIFYAREEVPAQHNGLGELIRERPELVRGDAAILGEPTNGELEAGCQGTLRIRATWRGERAHTARPWMGRNAIHRLGPVLERLEAYEERRPVIDGCEFREAVQAVGVEGGVAGNVVPDAVSLTVNHRYAPDRTAEEATQHLLDVLGDPDEWERTDLSVAAPPGLGHPLLGWLREEAGLPVRAKLGWTDVARFAELGVPAVNLGPGHSHLAHTQDEWVDRSQLERTYRALERLLSEGV